MSLSPTPKILPIHFLTIVLNGEPFIRYHLDAFKHLPFPWHWHVVEGIANLKHDSSWSVAGGGRINAALHHQGRSIDGTSEYLDQIAAQYPENISIYRKHGGNYWDGKREMVNAPLANFPEECLLWQVDVDELWSQAQIEKLRELFLAHPAKSAAWFWCHYFVGPELVTTTRNTYGGNPGYEWLRVWRYRKGMYWASHAPPRLHEKDAHGSTRDMGATNPFLHDEMEKQGLVFQHYAYVLPEQLTFKQSYYGYKNALAEWERLQAAADRPLKLADYFSWVKDEAVVDSPGALSLLPMARRDPQDGSWKFLAQDQIRPWRAKGWNVNLFLEHPRFRWRQGKKVIVDSLLAGKARWVETFFRCVSLWHLRGALNFLCVDLLLVSLVPSRSTDAVVVIKLDRLGDYILCRKFLRLIRAHPQYRSRKIHLCANANLKDLIETYDGDAFDGFVWIDTTKLVNEAGYRFEIFRKIKQLGAEIAIHPTFWREPYNGDCVVFATRAAERIGRESYSRAASPEGRVRTFFDELGDLFYHRIEPEDSGVVFDFHRYSAFFSKLLPGVEMPADTRVTPVPVPVPEIEGPFAVLMPGASQPFRQWPLQCFAEVARHLHATYGLRVVILGSPGDRPKAVDVQGAAPEIPMQNLCGDLTLPQMVWVIHQCVIGLTNESGGAHLFAALDKPAVAVANGNRFGWFHPYPKEFSSSVSFVYPPAFLAEKLTWEQRKEAYRADAKYHPLEELSAEAVMERIDAVLKGTVANDPIVTIG